MSKETRQQKILHYEAKLKALNDLVDQWQTQIPFTLFQMLKTIIDNR